MEVEGDGLKESLRECGALLTGHFVLSSGFHTGDYVQCARLLEDAGRARQVGAALARRLGPYEPESVLAPALGALIIGHEVAAGLGVPFRFTERSDGEMVLRRGFSLVPGERLVVVEDVVTTGRSTTETVAVAEAAGASVVAVGSILDRTGADPFAPLPFEALARFELRHYPAEECPLCRDGGVAERPGSRIQSG